MTEDNSTVEKKTCGSDAAMCEKGATFMLSRSYESLAIFATELFADKIREVVEQEEKESGLPVKAIVIDD